MGARSGTGGAGAGAADETPPSIVGGGGAAEDLANHQSAPSSQQRPRPVRQKRRSARMESEASKTAEAAVAKTVPKEKTTTDIDIGLGQAELSAAVRAAATIQATIEVSPYIQRSKKGPKRPMTVKKISGGVGGSLPSFSLLSPFFPPSISLLAPFLQTRGGPSNSAPLLAIVGVYDPGYSMNMLLHGSAAPSTSCQQVTTTTLFF